MEVYMKTVCVNTHTYGVEWYGYHTSVTSAFTSFTNCPESFRILVIPSTPGGLPEAGLPDVFFEQYEEWHGAYMRVAWQSLAKAMMIGDMQLAVLQWFLLIHGCGLFSQRCLIIFWTSWAGLLAWTVMQGQLGTISWIPETWLLSMWGRKATKKIRPYWLIKTYIGWSNMIKPDIRWREEMGRDIP